MLKSFFIKLIIQKIIINDLKPVMVEVWSTNHEPIDYCLTFLLLTSSLLAQVPCLQLGPIKRGTVLKSHKIYVKKYVQSNEK